MTVRTLLLFLGMVYGGVAAGSESQDLAAALDTPDWNWTAPAESGIKASIGTDSSATGGKKVILGNSKLMAQISRPSYVKFRYKGTLNYSKIGTFWMRSHGDGVAAGDAGTGWKTITLSAEKVGVMEIGGLNLEIDSVSLIVPSVGVADAIGIPGVALSFGGTSPIEVAPEGGSGLKMKYLAQATISTASKEAWMEFDVTGPATVDVEVSSGYGTKWIVTIDGKPYWDTDRDSYRFLLEVPSGRRTLRLAAAMASSPFSEMGALAQILTIAITPCLVSDLRGRAIELNQPLVIAGAWGVGAVEGAVNGTALKGVAPFIGANLIKTVVTGPCYVSYRSYLAPVAVGQPQTGLFFSSSPNDVSGHPARYSVNGTGWAFHPGDDDPFQRKFWMPPGEHWIRWSGLALGAASSGVAIDQVIVTPSPSLTVEEGSGLAGAEWINDPNLPWKGYERTHDGFRAVASPMLVDGGTSEIGLRLTGPGTLLYQTKRNQYIEWEVWANGVKVSEKRTSNNDGNYLDIPAGPATLVWKAISTTGQSSWMDLFGVKWLPTIVPEPFAAWAAALPEGKRLPFQDADDDGVSNLLEYGFGSVGKDAAQRPAVIENIWTRAYRSIRLNLDGSHEGPGGIHLPLDRIGYYDLKIPYIKGRVEGVLEFSDNLKEWEQWPTPLLSEKPAGSDRDGWSGWPQHTATHQAISIPAKKGSKEFFVRVRMTLTDPETDP